MKEIEQSYQRRSKNDLTVVSKDYKEDKIITHH